MSFARLSAFSGLARSTARRSFATYKTSTGLVGLAVDPNGRETLLNISNEILESIKVESVFESTILLKVVFQFSSTSNRRLTLRSIL
jgi:hypothetical protein